MKKIEAEEYMIKCRERGKRAWWFMTSTGGMNRLRIHAARIQARTIDGKTESAQWRVGFLIGQFGADNPEHEFKPVPVKK